MQIWKYTAGFLFLALLGTGFAVFQLSDANLHLIACDVGQGDAILATYGNIQILTDGGPPNGKVLDCLNRHIPFWDRKIELVVLTHPQLDHYGGLLGVFKRYEVGSFMANAVDSSNSTYLLLKNQVGGMGARVINPISGMRIRVGKIQLDVVNPSGEMVAEEGGDFQKNVLGAFTTERNLNDFSIVDILTFGDFDAVLTGDIDPPVINEVSQRIPQKKLEYIKVPHHGSKNGLTEEFLKAVNPSVAVISVGRNNLYGHPDEETLRLLKNNGIKTLRTDEAGDVEVISDGKRWWIK